MIISIYIAVSKERLDIKMGSYPLSAWDGTGYWRDGTDETITEVRSLPWPVQSDDYNKRRTFMLSLANDWAHKFKQSVLISDSKTFMSIDENGEINSSIPFAKSHKKKREVKTLPY